MGFFFFFFFFRFCFCFFVGVKTGAFDERFGGGLVVGEKVGAVGDIQTASAPEPTQRPRVVGLL